MAVILNFGGHFGSYINYYKSETFLMPNKTFVDIFIGVLQKNVLCRWLKRFLLTPIAAILELAAIVALNEKSEVETYQALLSTYR